MVRKEYLDPSVPLPPGLSLIAIAKAIDYLERQLAELVEIYYEQANVFSAIVGIFGTKALDSVSNYEKHRNVDTAQQRFPDLKRRGCGQTRSRSSVSKVKQANALGRSSRTMTILGGTSFGGTSLIRLNRLNLASQ